MRLADPAHLMLLYSIIRLQRLLSENISYIWTLILITLYVKKVLPLKISNNVMTCFPKILMTQFFAHYKTGTRLALTENFQKV